MNIKVALMRRPDSSFPKNLDIFQISYNAPPDQIKLREEELIVQNKFISIDAAMRVWISGAKTYMDPVGIGEVMFGYSVGVVLVSKSKKFQVGDWVAGMLGWQTYAAMPSNKVTKIPKNYPNPAHFLGVLGISGLTAYMGLKEIGQLKPGETIVISAAAGAVGEIAVGLARLWGGRVIGIAGSDEKCLHVTKTLGAEHCINYKKENVSDALKKHCDKGIDVYFDNVGGEILDAVLGQINDYARIVLCGAISGYNSSKDQLYRLKNYSRLIIKRGKMQGFIYFDYKDKLQDATKDLIANIQNGKIKFTEDFVEGIDSAPKALQRLLTGANTGKVIVKVKGDNDNIYLV